MKQGKCLTYRIFTLLSSSSHTSPSLTSLPQTKSNPKCNCNWPIKIQNQMMTYFDLLGLRLTYVSLSPHSLQHLQSRFILDIFNRYVNFWPKCRKYVSWNFLDFSWSVHFGLNLVWGKCVAVAVQQNECSELLNLGAWGRIKVSKWDCWQ